MGSFLQFISILAILLVECPNIWSQPIAYVSNLDDRWPGGGIGDIHGFEREPIVARFTTGNSPVELDAVTLEFLADKSLTGWENVEVELEPANRVAVTPLVNPVINPKPTQYPQNPRNNNPFTVYVDFHPSTATFLPPLTAFDLFLSAPIEASGLLYTRSSVVSALDGWTMGPTTSSNPFAAGEFVKLAVYATAVPEPSAVAILLGGSGIFWLARRKGSDRL